MTLSMHNNCLPRRGPRGAFCSIMQSAITKTSLQPYSHSLDHEYGLAGERGWRDGWRHGWRDGWRAATNDYFHDQIICWLLSRLICKSFGLFHWKLCEKMPVMISHSQMRCIQIASCCSSCLLLIWSTVQNPKIIGLQSYTTKKPINYLQLRSWNQTCD